MSPFIRVLLFLTGSVMLVTLPANKLTPQQQVALGLMGAAVAIRDKKN
jgi:hypothetical protein